jgi:hypothetical protein
MSRFKAALIHLAISASIALGVLAFMLTVWYPGPFFNAVGGGGLILIMMGVDVAIGPLLTLIVFKAGKKRLRMDLTVIGVLQLAAFVYGVSVIFAARPAYVAFVVDRFELVRAADLDPEDIKHAKVERFRSLPLFRPEVIAVTRPTDPDERLKSLDLALQGKELHARPEHYTGYESQKEQVRLKLQPLKRLKELNPAQSAEIDRAIRDTGRNEDSMGFLPLRGREKDLSVIVDKATGDIIDYWNYSPWQA